MNSVNKTLYIPLYGKAYVSKKGLFLQDWKAEEIWEAEGFALKGKSRSKWLAYYMGIRSAVFDAWVTQQMTQLQDAVMIHIGCGMDSRVIRVAAENRKWYDVDLPEVIAERKKYYADTDTYQMLAGDARDCAFLTQIPETHAAIVILEGVSMYLTVAQVQNLMDHLCTHFEKIAVLVDCYTSLAAKMSKHGNPIKNVGATKVYGIDTPHAYQSERLAFVKEHPMTPQTYINELTGFDRQVFSRIYAGSFSKKLYRLYSYKKG